MALAGALLGLVLALASGSAGLDFGTHWDQWQHTDAAYKALHTGLLLPDLFNHPSLTFDLTFASLAAQLAGPTLEHWRAHPAITGAALREFALAWADGHREALELGMRRAFLVLSQLTALALLLGVGWLAGWRVGLLAALLLSTANAFLSHSRFIAPDTLMALGAALTLAAVLRAGRTGRFAPLVLAAVAAGLTTSAKYTGVFALLPVLLAGPLLLPRAHLGANLRRAALLCVVAAAAFLLTTPGALVRPFRVLEHVVKQQGLYAAGYRVHAVDAGLPHLGHVLTWFGTALFSTSTAYSLVAAALGLLGLVVAVRRWPRHALLGASFVVPYLSLLCGSRTFIVRNEMVLVPLAALCVAVGVDALLRRLPRRAALGAGLLVALALTGNGLSQLRDGLAIGAHAKDPAWPFLLAKRDLESRTGPPVYLAADTRQFLKLAGLSIEGTTDDPDRAELALIVPQYMPSTGPGPILRWYGTREVDFPYYQSWIQRKPVLVPIEVARAFGEL